MTNPSSLYENQVCSVCGNPATSAARDMAEVTGPMDDIDSWTPVGPLKYGCDDHRAESVQFPSLQAAAEAGLIPLT